MPPLPCEKTDATVIFFEPDYYVAKEQFINDRYNVALYVTLNTELVGTEFNGKTLLSLSEAAYNMRGKIIIAVLLSEVLNRLVQLLLDTGVDKDDIVLTFNIPGFVHNTKDGSFNELVSVVPGAIEYGILENGNIACAIEGKKLLVSTYDELFIVKEIFYDKCYDFTTPHNSLTVVDIGMNIGTASLFFASKQGVNRVYSFEPFPATFERALENFRLNELPENMIFPHSYGISNETKVLEVPYDRNWKGHMSTVLHSETAPSLEKAEIEVVDIAQVFSAIIELHPEDQFVFKVDCEGGEYEIFDRLNETGLIKKIHIIILEWHNIAEVNGNIARLERVLEQNGFIYHVIGTRHAPTGMLFATNGIV